MTLYKLDVSQNEVINLALSWLPDVYYFPPLSSDDTAAVLLPIAPIRYDDTTTGGKDDVGNGVGRISDPMDILEWWLDVMMGSGNHWMDPDVLLNILNNGQSTTTEEDEKEEEEERVVANGKEEASPAALVEDISAKESSYYY